MSIGESAGLSNWCIAFEVDGKDYAAMFRPNGDCLGVSDITREQLGLAELGGFQLTSLTYDPSRVAWLQKQDAMKRTIDYELTFQWVDEDDLAEMATKMDGKIDA